MYCHNCDKHFSIDMDMKADGNHVFKCPHCQHEHCQVVKEGEITSDRWDQRNGARGAVYQPNAYTSSASDTYSAHNGTASTFLGAAWNSSSTGTATW